VSSLAEQLIAGERKLTGAWSDPLPPLTDAVRADADRARELDIPTLRAGDLPGDGLPEWARAGSAHWLGRLASAYRETHDEIYARAAKAVYHFWIHREPLVDGRWVPSPDYDILRIPHWLGDTECVGWFGALPTFLDCDGFDERFLENLLQTAAAQLDYLAVTLHDGRNIRMTQADSLLTQGLRLSFLPGAERWRQLGLDALNDAFNRQICADGSHVEATGWYHFIAMNMAYRFWRLSQALPELGLQISREQVAAMFGYTCASVEPSGRLTTIGDCTRSRIGTGGDLRSVLDRRSSALTEMGLPDEPSPLSQFFPDAGQAFLRDGWGPNATYVTFDGTRRNGYHWHPARNSVQLHAFGQPILVDPGRLAHAGGSCFRQYAISTRAHSTINLNGWNQTWTPARFRTTTVSGFDIVDCLYDGGYWPSDDEFAPEPGIFGQHHRTLLWIRDRAIVVLDHLHHRQCEGDKPDIECNWQFAPGTVEIDTQNCRARSQHGEARCLTLFPVAPAGTVLSAHEGERDPLAGWISDDADRAAPAPLLRLRAAQYEPWHAHFATVILPFLGENPPDVTVERAIDPGHGHAGHFSLRWGDGRLDEVWWTRDLEYALEEKSDFASDAALVYRTFTSNGTLERALVVDGTYLRPYTKESRLKPETFVVPGR